MISSRRQSLPKRSGLPRPRSEEHTSELQSQSNLVCRLLLEKKKTEFREPDNANAVQHDDEGHGLREPAHPAHASPTPRPLDLPGGLSFHALRARSHTSRLQT